MLKPNDLSRSLKIGLEPDRSWLLPVVRQYSNQLSFLRSGGAFDHLYIEIRQDDSAKTTARRIIVVASSGIRCRESNWMTSRQHRRNLDEAAIE